MSCVVPVPLVRDGHNSYRRLNGSKGAIPLTRRDCRRTSTRTTYRGIVHGTVEIGIEGEYRDAPPVEMTLKSCNRSARFLPINISNERNHLSFSNHCVAAKSRPCSQSSFGRLREAEGERFSSLSTATSSNADSARSSWSTLPSIRSARLPR